MAIIRLFIASSIMAVLLSACSLFGSKTDNDQDYSYDSEAEAPAEVFAIPEPYQDELEKQPVSQVQPVSTAKVETKRIAIRENTPDSYTVKRGDTLWGIATYFLQDPWLWPQIWYFNPQIANPHLIYPGDRITLVYVDGKPQLRLQRAGDTQLTQVPTQTGLDTFKLSPRVRTENINSAIPTVPLNAIRPFLINPRVVSEEELNASPYVLTSLDKHLISGVGNKIYVRGLDSANESRYNIFRPSKKFYDPETGNLLGIETIKVSEAALNHLGDPSTMTITNSFRETLNGDRILPAEEGRLSYNFIPKAPENDIEGSIVSLVDSISYTSSNQIVVINLGLNDNVDVGTVFAIDQNIGSARDHWSNKRNDSVQLPKLRVGLLMVFRSFDQLSYAIVVDSKRPISSGDHIRSPSSAVND